MNYNNSEFLASYGLSRQLPDSDRPEIVFSGRSNVGKSSLINKLCNRKKLARVSATPGKTATINFYRVDTAYFVDLPGYGFAKTSQENKDSWSSFIDEYMKKSPGLIMIGLLLDLRHPGLPIDLKAFDWLKKAGIPIQIIATKGDKLSRNDLKKNLMQMKKLFPTVFHSSAENLAAMIVSAGKIGYQVELAPHDLAALVRAKFADIIVE